MNKSFAFPEGKSSVAFAFSGSVDHAKAAINEIWESVANLNQSEFAPASVKRVITASLQQFHEQHLYPHPHFGRYDGPSISLLIAFRSHISSRLHLYRSNETVLIDIESFGAVGSGVLLSDYLIPISYKHNKMSLQDVTTIAIYVLYQTKRYVDGCGGSSEFLVLHDSGTLERVDPVEVRLGERYSDFYDTVLRNVFLLASDDKATDDDLRKATDLLFGFVQSHRDTIRSEKAMRASVVDALTGKVK